MNHKRLLKMDSNHLQCIFYKDPYTGEIFEGVFAKDQFMKKERTCVFVNEQISQFHGSHWVMVYEDKEKTYFIVFLGRDFTTMASSSRDPFTKYLEDYNVYTRNYVELILCFLDSDWQKD